MVTIDKTKYLTERAVALHFDVKAETIKRLRLKKKISSEIIHEVPYERISRIYYEPSVIDEVKIILRRA